MEYRICDWEDNGYNDSYFYVGIWDTEKHEIRSVMYGSTAFGGGTPLNTWPMLKDADPAIKQEFKEWYVKTVSKQCFDANDANRNEPKSIGLREDVIIIRDVKKMKPDKKTIPSGTRGRVFWIASYGKFYAKGYNKPNRNNTSIGIETNDGERLFIPLNSVSLDKEIEPIEEIENRIKMTVEQKIATVGPLTGCRSWLSGEYWN